MQFNSFDFAVFLPIVFLIYWFVFNKNLKMQNFFLLASSYFFYAWWDWRFLFLIIFITCVDYFTTRMMVRYSPIKVKRLLLFTSLFANLGLLFFFKYYNFFIESFISSFTLLGIKFKVFPLNIILPLGISFYIFQSLSYVFDVYLEKIEPTKNIIIYALFISFFPKLVMGPIEKPSHLLPQFFKLRKFNYNLASDGTRQMLWGFFKKMVIADNLAPKVDYIFKNHESLPASVIVLGIVFFAFQIYCDFSGYSDIAIGCSRLLGFNIMDNFRYPYFSRNIADFWRRWHISLTRWLTDYIFLPIQMKFRNLKLFGNGIAIIATFLICGLWHGANWTFIIWGLLNALYFFPLILFRKSQVQIDQAASKKLLPGVNEFFQIILTFSLICIAWVFFKADSISSAINILYSLFSPSLFSKPIGIYASRYLLLIALLIGIEWVQRDKPHGLYFQNRSVPTILKAIIYVILIFSIILLSPSQKSVFIYFQF